MEAVLNNIDIVRLIYSFGDVSHRENMKKIKKEIVIYTKEKWSFIIEDIFKLHIKKWSENKIYDSFGEYIYHIFNKKTCISIIKLCSRCKCCEKHSKNKPFIIDNIMCLSCDEKYEIPEKCCNCQCRHLSRNTYRVLLTLMSV